jgi:hypothetical protein
VCSRWRRRRLGFSRRKRTGSEPNSRLHAVYVGVGWARVRGPEKIVFGLGRLRAPLARRPNTKINPPEFFSSRRFTVTARDALRASPAMVPARPPAAFFHPDGVKRPSRAPGSSFSPGFGPSSIRRAQAIPGPPGRARGLRTREKWKRARSVGERTRKPYNLVANLPLPPLVALSPPAPPLANPPAGCLNSAVPPPTSPHQPIFHRPACRLAIFRR